MEGIAIMIIEDQDREIGVAEQAVKKAFSVPPEKEGQYLGLESLKEKLGLPDSRLYELGNDMLLHILTVRNLNEAMEGFKKIDEFKLVFQKVGIITDLMFPGKTGNIQANGIEIILLAIEKSMPVVVCSDTDHHDVGFMSSLARTLGPLHPNGRIPVILDKKDWEKAVTEVVDMLKPE